MTQVAPPRLVWFGFDNLPPRLLYGVMALRQRVFVVEQRSAYVDLDGRDPQARHLVAVTEDDARPPPACGCSPPRGGSPRRVWAASRLPPNIAKLDWVRR